MRGAPHNGFAWLMSRIKWRMSAATFGLPGRHRDFRVQYHAKALRCQAITVSGRTMCRLWRQPGHHRESKTHKSRSERWRRKRRGAFFLENGELVAKRENLRLQCDTGSKTRGYQSEKGDDKRVHRDSTRISRMIGTSAFPARTEFSVTTPRKRESVDHACGPVCDSLQGPAVRRHRIRPAARDAGGPTTLRSRRTTRPQTRCTTLSSANSAASRLIKNHSSNHDARYNDFAR
jgi:hypothetical protein